jgi:hypothetical protein
VGNDPLPDEVETPLDNAINEIQTSLNEQPVVRVRVAPTRGEILGSDPGMEATPIARGVTIDILPLDVDIPFGDLNGIAQITIGEASAAAAVKDGQAIASNAAALVHVKVLNITTDDPDDVLLETTLPLPDQSLGSVDQVLLAGTPLQTTIKAASAPDPVQTCQQDGDRRRCEASAEADSFTVSIFDPVISDPVVGSESNPLPNITLEVASAQAAVVGTVQAAGAQPFLPIVLARTGALPLVTVLSGALLTMGALAVRRRFSR